MADALFLLEEDHRRIDAMLARLCENEPGEGRLSLLGRIEAELGAHAAVEQEIFYPALREAGGEDERAMFYEAIEEHRAVAELVLPDLKKAGPDSDRFSGRAKVLKEIVAFHAAEEETRIFARARALFSADDLDALGARMLSRRKELETSDAANRVFSV